MGNLFIYSLPSISDSSVADLLKIECYKEDNKDLIFWYFPTIVNPSIEENMSFSQSILKEVYNLILDPQIQYVGVSVACKPDLLKPTAKEKKLLRKIKKKAGNIRHDKKSHSYSPSPYGDKSERKPLKPLILQPIKKASPKKKALKKLVIDTPNDSLPEFKRRSDTAQTTRTEIPSTTSGTPKFNQESHISDSDFELGKKYIPKRRFAKIQPSPLKKPISNSTNYSNSSISSITSTNLSNRAKSQPRGSTNSSKITVPTLNIKPPSIKQPPKKDINTDRPRRNFAPVSSNSNRSISKQSRSPGRNVSPLKPVEIQTERQPADLSVIPESDKVTDTSNRSNDFFITGLLKKEETTKPEPIELAPPTENKHKVPQNAFTFNNMEKVLGPGPSNMPTQVQTSREISSETGSNISNKLEIPSQKRSALPKVFPRKISRGSSKNLTPEKSQSAQTTRNRFTEQSTEETSQTTSEFRKGLQKKAEYLDELQFQFEQFKKEMGKNPRAKIHAKLKYLDVSKNSSTGLSMEKKTIDTSRSINRESIEGSDSAQKPKKVHYRSKSISNSLKRQNMHDQQRSSLEFDHSSEDQSKFIPSTRIVIAKEPSGTKPTVPSFHFRRFSMGEMKTYR